MSTSVSVEHTVRDLGVTFDSRLTTWPTISLPYVALATTICVSSAKWYVPCQLMAPRQWSMPSFHAGLTTATRYLLAPPIASFVDYSRSRMRPPVLLPALLDVNTSRRYSGNFIGYHHVSVFGTSWQPWHSLSARRRRMLPTIASSLLNPDGGHSDQRNDPSASYNAATTPSATDHSQYILSACVERLTCYSSQHRADKGHFLQTSQNCFVYSFMRSRRI